MRKITLYKLFSKSGNGPSSLEPPACGQHPTPVALAHGNPAHREITAGLAVAFQRRAFAEPPPAALEPIRESDCLPRCVS
jgi:hypothetical protein